MPIDPNNVVTQDPSQILAGAQTPQLQPPQGGTMRNLLVSLLGGALAGVSQPQQAGQAGQQLGFGMSPQGQLQQASTQKLQQAQIQMSNMNLLKSHLELANLSDEVQNKHKYADQQFARNMVEKGGFLPRGVSESDDPSALMQQMHELVQQDPDANFTITRDISDSNKWGLYQIAEGTITEPDTETIPGDPEHGVPDITKTFPTGTPKWKITAWLNNNKGIQTSRIGVAGRLATTRMTDTVRESIAKLRAGIDARKIDAELRRVAAEETRTKTGEQSELLRQYQVALNDQKSALALLEKAQSDSAKFGLTDMVLGNAPPDIQEPLIRADAATRIVNELRTAHPEIVGGTVPAAPAKTTDAGPPRAAKPGMKWQTDGKGNYREVPQ